MSLVALALAAAVQSPEDLTLVWSDAFDRDGLPDPAIWTYDTHANATGWYNNELQYYAADRPENARVEDGRLIIEARREAVEAPDHGGQAYSSARLVSRDSWTYGRIEARAKLPCARGTWPAIWMLPLGMEQWPLDGEIDIMEHVGHDPGVVHGTVHTEAFNHVKGTQVGRTVTVPDACDAFHDYAVDWTPQAIVWRLDGVEYHRFDNDGSGVEAWPFDRPFQLILNVAVGGDWGGAEGVDEAAFPQRMEIDWVRVWRLPD